MSKIIFIIGGARSGKSSYALNLVKEKYKKVAFIATCLPKDIEMKKRIALHKKNRPLYWQTFENPKHIHLLLKKIGNKFEVIIIDCLTLWVSNFLLEGFNQNFIEKEADKLLNVLSGIKSKSIIVSNEVGLGIVPENKLARDFRDIAGRINQMVAYESNEVLSMISGIPLKIKGGDK